MIHRKHFSVESYWRRISQHSGIIASISSKTCTTIVYAEMIIVVNSEIFYFSTIRQTSQATNYGWQKKTSDIETCQRYLHIHNHHTAEFINLFTHIIHRKKHGSTWVNKGPQTLHNGINEIDAKLYFFI